MPVKAVTPEQMDGIYELIIYLVKTVYDGFKPAGVHNVTLSTQDLPHGMYFIVLETPTVRQKRSVVLVR